MRWGWTQGDRQTQLGVEHTGGGGTNIILKSKDACMRVFVCVCHPCSPSLFKIVWYKLKELNRRHGGGGGVRHSGGPDIGGDGHEVVNKNDGGASHPNILVP